MNVTSVTEKVLNACHRLNAEAYEYQVIVNKMRPLKHFTPCPRAEVLMSAIREGKHFGTMHTMAELTNCPCHARLTPSELMDYEYDETYKLANYNHDHKTLYPKLYGGTK